MIDRGQLGPVLEGGLVYRKYVRREREFRRHHSPIAPISGSFRLLISDPLAVRSSDTGRRSQDASRQWDTGDPFLHRAGSGRLSCLTRLRYDW